MMTQICISYSMSENLSYNHSYYENLTTEVFATHSHDRCELIYITDGELSYTVEGKSYAIRRGDIILARPQYLHNLTPKPYTRYERYDAIINHKLLPKKIWQKIKAGPDVYKFRANEHIAELFTKLDLYYKRFSDEDYARLAFNIIEEVFYNLTLFDGEAMGASTNPIIEKAIDYIQNNLTTLSGIEEISNALYITKSHLHHLFVEHLQITPAKYITAKRLQLAKKKIRRGEKPTAVFEECGFEDYATFFRNYKKHFGYSPALEGTVHNDVQFMS